MREALLLRDVDSRPKEPANATVPADSSAQASVFYRHVLQIMAEARVPHLLGGAYALAHHTHTRYSTKDLDLFLRRADLEPAFEALAKAGYRTELTHPHFLGKVYDEPYFADFIFGSGNGIVRVDDSWFEHASEAEVFSMPVKICSVEDVLWSKAFVMERERFDGGDISHLLLATGERMNWPRLLARFGPHWRVLLAHLVLFGFIYPGRRSSIPASVVTHLTDRLRAEDDASNEHLCQGGLLSRAQYLFDFRELGMKDARLEPLGRMTRDEIDRWSAAIDEE